VNGSLPTESRPKDGLSQEEKKKEKTKQNKTKQQPKEKKREREPFYGFNFSPHYILPYPMCFFLLFERFKKKNATFTFSLVAA
jgi:hypothetical protein